MYIRKYSSEQDDENLMKMIEDEEGWTYAEKETSEKYKSDLAQSITYVAYEENELCGYSRSVRDGDFYIYVCDLLVKPSHRGKNIGRKLMECIYNDFPDHVVYVMSDVDAYYEKQGYKCVGSIFEVPQEEKNMVKLENEAYEVIIQHQGAELISFKNKSDGIEYIWTGDAKYWARHAPVLFPIVGKVVNNTYRVGDESYHLNQHGLARDQNFELIESSKTSASFQLMWSQETLVNYPYRFELVITYGLSGSELSISYKVINHDEQVMYFNIGAHPGFNCPLAENETFEEYAIIFEHNETVKRMPLNKDGLLLRDKIAYLENERHISLNAETFKNDALIFEDLNSNRVSLINKKSGRGLNVDFTGFPFLGLWTKPEGAPFVCIEPWYGHADYTDFNGDFREKEDILRLEPKEIFTCQFSIHVEK
jgi:galactose mutarotase-like enzyme